MRKSRSRIQYQDAPGISGFYICTVWIGFLLCFSIAQAADTKLPGSFHAVDRPTKQAPKPVRIEPPLIRKWQHKLDGFYDPANPSYDQLQRPAESVAGLSADVRGNVDWMQVLRSGRIQPRSALSGVAGMEILDLDVVMKNTREMPFVRFPHRSHTEWLACSNCQPGLFEKRAGATSINMTDIFRGKYCGVCHDRVAFITFFACDRCHSVPQSQGNKLWNTAPETP